MFELIRNSGELRDRVAALVEELQAEPLARTDRLAHRETQLPLAEEHAQVDVRALPDENIEQLADALRKLINDSLVEVVPPVGGRPTATPSRHDTEMFHALERAQQRVFPGAVTLPMMVVGATDSAQLRAKGVQAYGVGNVYSENEVTGMHGNDERLSIAGLGRLIEFIWNAVTDIAAAK